MSGLKIGDLLLDPRGVVFLPSMKALVCVGLRSALSGSSVKSFKQSSACIDLAILQYKPDHLIVLDSLNSEKGLSLIAKKWGKKCKIIFVSSQMSAEVAAIADALKFEVHQELVWDNIRLLEKNESLPFLDSQDVQSVDFQFITISGGADYFVRIGKLAFDPLGLFSGEKLNLFLRGMGRLMLPSIDPNSDRKILFQSIEDPFFSRYDVFALGHRRILPLGKILDLKKYSGKNSIPVSFKLLSAKKTSKSVSL